MTVRLTRHAVQRLLERRPREYKKLSPSTLVDVVRNVVRDALYLATLDKVVVATRKYALICTMQGGGLVVKTVMDARGLSPRLKALIQRRGFKASPAGVEVELPRSLALRRMGSASSQRAQPKRHAPTHLSLEA